MPIVGASITPTGDSSVVGVGSIPATSTPVRSIPGIDVAKARKALEMGDVSLRPNMGDFFSTQLPTVSASKGEENSSLIMVHVHPAVRPVLPF